MLKKYIPRMVEDMLKLTIDYIFSKLNKRKRLPLGNDYS
jgi:hypothetical protein